MDMLVEVLISTYVFFFVKEEVAKVKWFSYSKVIII